jgi:hypothetical protein
LKRGCSMPGCENRAYGKGLCSKHYQRFWKRGTAIDSALTRRPEGTLHKWLHNAMTYRGGDCLEWPFTRHSNGYGNVTVNGKSHMPHRLVCIFAHGVPSADHLQVAHSCGNPPCCNPNHLRWATPAENAVDRYKHGTMFFGEGHHNSKLTDDAVRQILASKHGTLNQLAAEYGVSFQTISDIRRGKVWKRIAGSRDGSGHIKFQRREAV